MPRGFSNSAEQLNGAYIRLKFGKRRTAHGAGKYDVRAIFRLSAINGRTDLAERHPNMRNPFAGSWVRFIFEGDDEYVPPGGQA